MAIVLALLSALAYGISDFLGGIFSKKASPWHVAVVGQTSSTVTVTLVALLIGGSPSASDWQWGALAGVGGGFGAAFLYRGLASARMGVVAPLSAVGSALLPVAVGLVTGERPSMLAVIGIVCAFPAIYLISLVVDISGPTTRPGQTALPTLKESGADLMRRSRDVWNDEEAHPAYGRILSELAPDEGRVLVLLLSKGPQPSVDVRTGGPVGMLSSRLIAPGLTMIGSRAGLRHTDQVPAYLNNLFRLGLVWFSRETLRDVHQYQVVEAQPDVLAAMHSVRYAKVVRRSIHLTPFGEDFCKACLVLDAGEVADLPKHAQPSDDDDVIVPTILEN